ncbi:MAG: DUF421 domain-containing protein [Planctomycetota bacterium]|nr:DUF421 domain-containing protein [Planctomycetota bacterium]
MEGKPIVLVQGGAPLEENMRQERIDTDDILHAARTSQGLHSMEQIEQAVLERGGAISIIPAPSSAPDPARAT